MADEELIELKERAAAEFLRVPGVTAVGLGGRERDGRPTGEVVLKVFVERKRPAAELTPGQLLPPEFEGLGVDVVELPEPSLEDGMPEAEAARHRNPARPARAQSDLDQHRVPAAHGRRAASRSPRAEPGSARSGAS